jgi:hypothetical protein
MTLSRLSFCLSLGAVLLLAAPHTSAKAMPISGDIAKVSSFSVTDVQYSNSRGFRSCMRKKYGPRYYRGVKRAHRYFMAQACGG